MQLPLPAFTDSVPDTLTWSQTGGASVGGASSYEFMPYVHEATVGMTVGAASTVSAESLTTSTAAGGGE